jgi:hypothetical protein
MALISLSLHVIVIKEYVSSPNYSIFPVVKGGREGEREEGRKKRKLTL